MFGIVFRTIKEFKVITVIYPPHSRPTNEEIADTIKVSLPQKWMLLYPLFRELAVGRDAANVLIPRSCFCSVLLASFDSD